MDITDQLKATVGPAASADTGTTRDDAKKEDYGQFSTVAPDGKAFLNQQRLTPLEKQAQFREAASEAIGAALEGKSVDQQLEAGAGAATAVRGDPQAHVNLMQQNTVLPHVTEVSEHEYRLRAEQEASRAKKFADDTGLGDMFGAATREATIQGSVWAWARDKYDGTREWQPDPTFDPLSDREKWGYGRSLGDQQWLVDSVSAEEREWKLKRLMETDENYKILGAHGGTAATIVGLSAGFADIPGWVAGMGVGKVAQLASTAYRLQRVGTVAYGLAAAEGAAGNVAATAAIQAAGEHITPSDYYIAAGVGAVMGSAMYGAMAGVPAIRTQSQADLDVSVRTQADQLHNAALEFSVGIKEEAGLRVGPNGTPDQYAQAERDIYAERHAAYQAAMTAPLRDSDRLMPDIGEQQLVSQNAEGEDVISGGLTRAIERNFRPAAQRAAAGESWGFTPDSVPDNAMRLEMTEMAARIDEQGTSVDPERLNTLWSLMPDFVSKAVEPVALRLGKSANKAMQWASSNLSESPTQHAGGKASAGLEIDHTMRIYNSYGQRVNEIYTGYRNQNGGNAVQDAIGRSKHYENFHNEVARVRNLRAMGQEPEVHPHIAAAADALDELAENLRLDQINAKTLGSDILRARTSRGYAPRVLNATWLVANPAKAEAVRADLARQLAGVWSDMDNGLKFAKDVAATMINRAKWQRSGGEYTPANVFDPDSSSALRDALAQHAIPEAEIEKYLSRVSRAGGSQTKGRMEYDTNVVLEADGQPFNMSEAWENNHLELLQAQARRVAADVALARRGIMGRKGLTTLRSLAVMGKNPASKGELEAFDQLTAELYGQRYKGPGSHSSVAAQRIMKMVTAAKLGQAVIPQVAETGNLVTTMGVKSAMDFVEALPRLVDEVRTGKPNALLQSIDVPGGKLGEEAYLHVPWKSEDDFELSGAEAHSVVDRALNSVVTAQHQITFHRIMQAVQTRGAAEQIIQKAVKMARDGGDDVALRSMGINADLQAAIKKDLKNIVKFDEDGNVTWMDVSQGTDPVAMNAFVNRIERGARQIVQGEFAGERGAWIHNDWLKLMFQFRRYPITAVAKQFARQRMDQGTVKAVALMMGQMSMSLPIHLARVGLVSATMTASDKEAYLENQLSASGLSRAALQYSSMTGLLGDTLDFGAGLAGMQTTGARGMGGGVSSLVPAVGYLDGAHRAIKGGDVGQMIKSMPFGNTLYMLPVVNGANYLQDE